jgi:ribosomal protein L39E
MLTKGANTMNKNQKHQPYTYGKLIKGNRIVTAFLKRKIDDLKDKIAKATRPNSKVPKDTILDWRNQVDKLKVQVDYFEDEFCRYSLAQAVCGNETILIK